MFQCWKPRQQSFAVNVGLSENIGLVISDELVGPCECIASMSWLFCACHVCNLLLTTRYIYSSEFRDNSLQAICHISPASRVFLLLIIISSIAVAIFQSLYLGACVLSRTGCLGSWDSYKPIWVQNNLSVSERVFINRFGPVLALIFAGVMASLYDAWYYVNTKGQIDKLLTMMMEGIQIITPMSTWCFWEMALEF